MLSSQFLAALERRDEARAGGFEGGSSLFQFIDEDQAEIEVKAGSDSSEII